MSDLMNTLSAVALAKAGYTLSIEGRMLRTTKDGRYIEAAHDPDHHAAERIWAAIAAEAGLDSTPTP